MTDAAGLLGCHLEVVGCRLRAERERPGAGVTAGREPAPNSEEKVPDMPKFRKKPVEIEAVQWLGIPIDDPVKGAENMGAIEDWWIENDFDQILAWRGDKVEIDTLEGTMTASPGDWIICSVHGELYPCKPDIFEATYEPCE